MIFFSETVGGDLASSDVAGRAVGTRPQPRKEAAVSWSR